MQYKRRYSSETLKPVVDRRVFSRRHIKLATMVETPDGRAQLCWSEDVSCGGMKLSIVEPLAVGQVVTVRFELPGKVPMEFEAEVVRREGRRVGLKFLDMNAIHGQLLQSILFAGPQFSARPLAAAGAA